jgi:processive 1,2-diacylglycerol beta-glucosyltransferase
VSASTSVGEAGAVVLDAQTGAKIAQLTDDQLAWLGRHLELESSGDTDYDLDRPTIEMLERAGADTALVATLRSALGAREGIDVRWSRGSK